MNNPFRLAFFLSIFIGCSLLPTGVRGQESQSAIPDTRGPVINAGMHVITTDDGVEAPDYVFHNPGPKPGDWSAKWITLADGQHAKDGINAEATLFRKEVDLPQAPTSVTAWLTAANYRLYINGKMASRGPADFGRDYPGTPSGRWFYDVRNLTPLFHAGKNVIAVEVFGGPGLLFEASVQSPGGNSDIESDESWQTAPSNYLQLAGAHPEDDMGGGPFTTFDGNEEPVGWQLPGFDDSSWGAAKIGTAPQEQLVASEIPPLMEIHYPVLGIIHPQGAVEIPPQPFQDGHSVKVTGHASFTVRFDRVMPAHCGIAVKGGQGARIYLEGKESGSDPGKTWVVVLRDGLQFFESPDYYSVSQIRVTVRNVTSPVEILDVSANYRSQPISYKASFACSDDYLTQVWKDCRWAVQINLQTHHLDSPQHQEPICDYGDYLIEDLAAANAFGPNPSWIARQDLRKWSWVMKNAHYQTFHTSYTLLWVQALLNYYDNTGDKDLLVELAPAVNELMDQFATYIGSNGIVSDAPNYMFMDWVTIDGFACHHPPAVIGQGYMTAFYYEALADAIRVADITGDQDRSSKYTQMREQINEAYNQELWNDEQGLYRDGKPNASKVPPNGWMPADTNIETFSSQNNSLAVLYDLAPPKRQAPLMEKVMATTPWNVRPYFMQFVFAAISHAGLFDQYGTTWMRKWKIVPETQSFREMGDQGDLSHAWIASPLYQMSTQILGITPLAPAFAEISIRPHLCDLASAKGSVWTIHGNVDVSWERKADKLDMKLTVPPGTQAIFSLPLLDAKSPAITAEGNPFWSGEKAVGTVPGILGLQRTASTLDMKLAPGTYAFTASGLPVYVPPPPADADAGGNATVTSDGPTSIIAKTDALDTLESDVPKKSLIAVGSNDLAAVDESGLQNTGGGINPDAIHNGTSLNGSGGDDTTDDGATFRGYGSGSSLIFHLNIQANPAGYDLTSIRSFASHSDGRCSQNYTISIAYASSPTDFVPFTNASVSKSDGGATEIVLKTRDGGVLKNGKGVTAAKVAAVKFDFMDGPSGFCVYREFSVVGTPSK